MSESCPLSSDPFDWFWLNSFKMNRF